MKRNIGGGGAREGSVKCKYKPSSESVLVVYVWFVWTPHTVEGNQFMLLIRRPKNPTLLPKKIAVTFENIMAIYQRHLCGGVSRERWHLIA